jgi:hypothetical protein
VKDNAISFEVDTLGHFASKRGKAAITRFINFVKVIADDVDLGFAQLLFELLRSAGARSESLISFNDSTGKEQ